LLIALITCATARAADPYILKGLDSYWNFEPYPPYCMTVWRNSPEVIHFAGYHFFPDRPNSSQNFVYKPGVLGKSLYFGGPAAPTLVYSDFPVSNPEVLTISLWAWMEEKTHNATMVSTSSKVGAGHGPFQLCVRDDGISVIFGVLDPQNNPTDRLGPVEVLSTGVPLPLREWHHLALVLNEPEARVYLDANEIGHIALKHRLCPTPMSSMTFGIRRLEYQDSPKTWNTLDAWQGCIDEAAMWNRELRPSEIASIRTATLHGESIFAAVSVPYWYQTATFRISIAGAIVTAIAVLLHYVRTWHLRRRVALLEIRSILEKDRQRFSENIHDELGARLVKLALYSDQALAGGGESMESLKTISRAARDANRSLDELVWASKPSHDSLVELADYLADYASEFLEDTGVALRLDIPETLPEGPLTPSVRHEMVMAAKEAFTNIIKHAKATEIGVKLRIEGKQIQLDITDNGIGIAEPAPHRAGKRNGLRTMCDRLERLGGRCQVKARSGGGTSVEFSVPHGIKGSRRRSD
jgi:signal transduction histidine kinase